MNIIEKYTVYKKGALYNLSGVYCIRNLVNNHRYIGESKNLEKRLVEHLTKLIGKYHINTHLQNAINLYGIENFEISVLEICNSEDTKAREYFWANYYNSEDKSSGYNIKRTDPTKFNRHSRETIEKIINTKRRKAEERGYWMTQETINKIQESRKWYRPSEETKRKIGLKSRKDINIPPQGYISLNQKRGIEKFKRTEEYKLSRRGISNITEEGRKKISEFNKGKKLSEETKKKLSQSHLGRVLSDTTKEKIRQFNLGKKMSSYNRLRINEVLEKPVIQYTIDNVEVNRFSCITDAKNFTHINASSIGACCSGKRKSAGKFKWKFIKDEEL